ncbi:MAG: 8-oxo-dGTP diphosphatase [Halobacteriales archaeon]
MDEATLCYVVDGDRVLLIEKQRGLGAGLYNGPGGKIEPGETPREAIEREVREEVGIAVTDARKVAELTFRHDADVVLFAHVFRATDFEGEPRSSPEAIPAWFDRQALPYDEMWADDHLWLPHVIAGTALIGEFAFEGGESLDDATFVDHDIDIDPDGFEGPPGY